ncbi:MAG: hypothetical protein WD691_10060 [Acidimicrobiales bacterium]
MRQNRYGALGDGSGTALNPGGTMHTKRKIQAVVALSAMALYAFGGLQTAEAKASDGSAYAFGAKADLLGTNLIPPTPEAIQDEAAADETDATLIGIPASPLLINGTLVARTIIGPEVPSELTVASQSMEGPYSARAIGQIEDLSVLIETAVPGGMLVSADAVRAEAVASCSGVADGDEANYSAASEVVDLRIAGDESLTGPLNDLVKQLTDALNTSPLVDVLEVQLNVLSTPAGGGAAVDAIVITVLKAIAGTAPGPLAQITLGHAEVGPTTCGGGLPSANAPECSDGKDNADTEDTLADEDDPGCFNKGVYDPNDTDERNECNDGIDNDDREDDLIDALDPGCLLAGVWNPADPSESNALARTGVSIPTGLAAGLGIGALGLLALRRRVLV